MGDDRRAIFHRNFCEAKIKRIPTGIHKTFADAKIKLASRSLQIKLTYVRKYGEDLRGRHARIGRAVLFGVGTIEDCSAMAVLGIGIIPKFPYFILTLPYR